MRGLDERVVQGPQRSLGAGWDIIGTALSKAKGFNAGAEAKKATRVGRRVARMMAILGNPASTPAQIKEAIDYLNYEGVPIPEEFRAVQTTQEIKRTTPTGGGMGTGVKVGIGFAVAFVLGKLFRFF